MPRSRDDVPNGTSAEPAQDVLAQRDADAADGETEAEALEDTEEPAGPPAAEAAPTWLIDFRRSDNRRGFYHSDRDFAALHVDRGREHLVVAFDNLSSARDDSVNRDPWGYGFVAKNGWSQLGILTFRSRWFRHPELFAYLEDLATSGFFRGFRHVTLIGTSMGGYAACAFASLVPGCRIIAFSPQSTLRADLVPWEDRFAGGRKADWSGPYADAVTEIRDASQVWLVYDPFVPGDAAHIARFSGPNVHLLRARHGGHKTAMFLRRAELLSATVRDVVEGRMSEQRFYHGYRKGRQLPWFLNGVAARADERGRPALIGRVMMHARARGQGFAAHVLRKKYLENTALDPLRHGSDHR